MSVLKSKPIDMLEGPILKNLVIFGFPIFLGNVFQQLYNMVDSIIVGKYVSANALAAVGSTSTLSFLFIGMLMGFSMDASVVVSQFLGAGQTDKIKPTISTSLYFLVVFAIVLSIAGFALAKWIMKIIKVPDVIFEDSVLYFRIYMISVVLMALYNFFASFLRALGDSVTPLIFLIIACVLNIFGDMFFVLVLHMGVAGVAWATDLAQLVSVILCFVWVSKKSEYFHFGKGELVFDKELFRHILRLGLPSALQNSVTGIGMVAVQGLINSYGAVSMAAYTAASKMEQICNLPQQGIAMALSLFVGQNVGAHNISRCKKGLYQAVGLVVALSILFSGAIFIFGKYIMLLFVDETELEVIEVGADFMKIWAPLVFAHAINECLVAHLRGAGDSIFSMISMFCDLLIRMVMAYVFALAFNIGFMGIAYAIPCGWFCSAIVSFIRYLNGGWKKKAVV